MKELFLDEMKKVEVNLLKHIDEVCRENNIEYCVWGGTLLGAIRHKGFIPWDDDIDIILERKNYVKLLKILAKENFSSYKLLDHSIQEDYYFPYAKYVDTNTIMIENNRKKIDNYGVFVDIFAFDHVPDDKKIIHKQYKTIRRLYWLLEFTMIEKYYNKNIIKNFVGNFLRIYTTYFLKQKNLLKKYNEVTQKYNNQEEKYCMVNSLIYKEKNEIKNRKSFSSYIDAPFEDIIIKIPTEYDDLLKTTYGDYMELPPVEKRVTHHQNKVYWKNT